MSASIVLTGLAANDPVPGIYEEINFAAGQSSGYGGLRATLMLVNAAAAGAATRDTMVYGPDTQFPLQTENDMIYWGGAGSEGHRCFLRYVAVNTSSPLYFLFVTESTGAKASGTITIANTANVNGTHRLWVGDDFVDTPITSGDTPTTIATNIVASVATKYRWPVVATNAAGVVTLTAVQKGPRGNWIRFSAMVLPTPTPNVVTTTGATDAFLTGGTTSDSSTNALATIAATGYYRIVSAAEDATQLGALVTQVLNMALPTTGIRQRVFAGSVDTLANATTIATGVNSARCEIMWLQYADQTPAELASMMCAIYALYEDSGSKPRNNFSGFPVNATDQTSWTLKAPRNTSVAPTRAQIKSALMNGLTPVGVRQNGSTYLVKRVTSRSLNGSVQDFRIRDAHKVTICDFFADDLNTILATQYGGKDLTNDPPQGQAPRGDAQLVFPLLIKNTILSLIGTYAGNGLLQNVDTIRANTIVQREANPTTRVSASIPLQPVDILDQLAMQINQVA